MDPANPDTLQEALSAQGILVGQHDQLLSGVMGTLLSLSQSVQQIAAQVSQLSATRSSTPPPVSNPPVSLPSVPAKEPMVPTPEPYAGEPGSCSRFLLNCTLVFDLQPSSYSTDKASFLFKFIKK